MQFQYLDLERLAKVKRINTCKNGFVENGISCCQQEQNFFNRLISNQLRFLNRSKVIHKKAAKHFCIAAFIR